jgi:gas vesicle protein
MTDRPDPQNPVTGGPASTSTPGPTNPGDTGGPGKSGPGTGKPGSGGGSSEGMKETARSAVSDAADAARGMASDQTERAKGAVADEVSSVAHALRTAADDLREGSAQERTFAQIADTLADTAEAIRDKDLGEMVREATAIARRHPMTFLGGAALLGFTAVRFAKASRDDVWRRRAGSRAGYAGARHGVSPAPADPAAAARTGSTP